MERKPNLKKLVEDRDQIWAEAVNTWSVREEHWNPEIELDADFIAEKEIFDTYDPWESIIEDFWLRRLTEFSIDALFEHMQIRQSDRTKSMQLRITRLLKAQGFTKARKRGQGKRKYLWGKS